jgi:hypothetical protein
MRSILKVISMSNFKRMIFSLVAGIFLVPAAFASPTAIEAKNLYEAFLANQDVVILTFDGSDEKGTACADFDRFLRDEKYSEFMKEMKEQPKGTATLVGWRKQICEEKRTLSITVFTKQEVPKLEDKANGIQTVDAPTGDDDDRLAVKTKINADLSGSLLGGNDKFLHTDATLGVAHNVNLRNILGASASMSYESDSEVRKESAVVFYNYLLSEHWYTFATVSVAHNHAKELAIGEEAFAGVGWNVFPISQLNQHLLSFTAAIGGRRNKMQREDPNTFTIAAASYRIKYEQTIASGIKFMADLFFQNAIYGPPGPGETPRAFDFSDNRILGHAKLQFGKDDGLHFNMGFTYDRWNKPFLGSKKTDTDLEFGIGYGLFTKRKPKNPFASHVVN